MAAHEFFLNQFFKLGLSDFNRPGGAPFLLSIVPISAVRSTETPSASTEKALPGGAAGIHGHFRGRVHGLVQCVGFPFSRALLDTSRSFAAVSSGVRLKWSMAMQQNLKSALLRFLPLCTDSSRQRSAKVNAANYSELKERG
jgi:hypothetical protein